MSDHARPAPPLTRDLMLRACAAVAATLDPINRARRPLAERDLQTVFLHDTQPMIEEWWELFGESIYDAVATCSDADGGDIWAVAAAAVHAHHMFGAPIDAHYVTETAKLAIDRMKPLREE